MTEKPYTCMYNPLLPAIGISFSGVTMGYIDLNVWVTFFVILILISLSYVFVVIP